MESRKDYFVRIFNEARAIGLCKNQNEFAELLGMHPSTVSNALKGDEKYLTDSLMKRVASWERQVLKSSKEAHEESERPDIVIPAATMDLYTSMAKSIDRLTALVERMQPGTSAYTGAYAPKNFSPERK